MITNPRYRLNNNYLISSFLIGETIHLWYLFSFWSSSFRKKFFDDDDDEFVISSVLLIGVIWFLLLEIRIKLCFVEENEVFDWKNKQTKKIYHL